MKTSIKAIAHHEAGHAVMAWYLNVKIRKATIVPDLQRGDAGSVHHAKVLRGKFPEMDNSDAQRMRIEKRIMVCLAGPIAQILFNPRSFRRYHAGGDWDQAYELSNICCGSEITISRHLEYLERRTKDALQTQSNQIFVEAVANELLLKRTLGGKNIAVICREAWKKHRLVTLAPLSGH